MLFEVVRTPDGESPKWVRDAWVGVQFLAQQGAPMSMPTRAAGTRTSAMSRLLRPTQTGPGVTERRGYSVSARDVLGLLALRNEAAARWYLDHVPQMLNPDQVFMFDETCCRAITELSNR